MHTEGDKIEDAKIRYNLKSVAHALQVPFMYAILFFSTNGISSNLKRPDLIDSYRTDLLRTHYRHMKYVYGENEATKHLGKEQEIISLAHEAQSIWARRRLPSFSSLEKIDKKKDRKIED